MVTKVCAKLTRHIFQPMLGKSRIYPFRNVARYDWRSSAGLSPEVPRTLLHSTFRPIAISAGQFSTTGGCQGNDGAATKSADDCGGNKFAPACIAPALVADYEEIVDLPNHPEKLLIDVREPAELAATGQIPTSINIPLKTVRAELSLGSDEFEAKYGRKKPTVNDPIIFSCRSGVRAGEAALQADQLGFRNVKNYVGSWKEYGPKHGLPVS